MITYLQLHPNVRLVGSILVGVLLFAGIAFAFHWWVLDVRWWFWRNTDLPGPASAGPDQPAIADSWAGELHHDDWDRLDPDQAADQLIAEWHDEPVDVRNLGPLDDAVGIIDRRNDQADHLEPWQERAWWDDPDPVVWDARRQADRCWEILHVEFPRLRAELCGVPAA